MRLSNVFKGVFVCGESCHIQEHKISSSSWQCSTRRAATHQPCTQAQPVPLDKKTQVHSGKMVTDSSSDSDFESWLTEKLDGLGLDAEVCTTRHPRMPASLETVIYPVPFLVLGALCCTRYQVPCDPERNACGRSLARLEHSCSARCPPLATFEANIFLQTIHRAQTLPRKISRPGCSYCWCC